MYSGNSYKQFPELYDLLYQRYLKSVPDFVALVKKYAGKEGEILDIAAGTGEVTIPLLRAGYAVTSVDQSAGMLAVLRKKARKAGVSQVSARVLDMQHLDYVHTFDVVCVRQAINYFMGNSALLRGLRKIHRSLRVGGTFIFNAPNYRGEKSYPLVQCSYETKNGNAFVLETNIVKNAVLRHTQYSLVWGDGKLPRHVVDENTFYMFTKKEFALALKEAGFSRITWGGSKKTLYCIAKK